MKLIDFVERGLKRDLADYANAIDIERFDMGLRVRLVKKVPRWKWREIDKICRSWRLGRVDGETWEATILPEEELRLSDLAV